MVILLPSRAVAYATPGEESSAALAVRETAPPQAPKPRLLDRVREAVRARHYSRRTEKTYPSGDAGGFRDHHGCVE